MYPSIQKIVICNAYGMTAEEAIAVVTKIKCTVRSFNLTINIDDKYALADKLEAFGGNEWQLIKSELSGFTREIKMTHINIETTSNAT